MAQAVLIIFEQRELYRLIRDYIESGPWRWLAVWNQLNIFHYNLFMGPRLGAHQEAWRQARFEEMVRTQQTQA